MTLCGLDYYGIDVLGVDPTLDEIRLGNGVLKKGAKGSSVSDLQRLLGIGVDGDFGTKTEAAVEKFQKANGLKVDGVVGRETIAALDEKLMSGGGIQTIDFSDSPEVISVKKPSAVKQASVASKQIGDSKITAIAPTSFSYRPIMIGGAVLGVGAIGLLAYLRR